MIHYEEPEEIFEEEHSEGEKKTTFRWLKCEPKLFDNKGQEILLEELEEKDFLQMIRHLMVFYARSRSKKLIKGGEDDGKV